MQNNRPEPSEMEAESKQKHAHILLKHAICRMFTNSFIFGMQMESTSIWLISFQMVT